jgi:hypothetical protein
LQGKWITQHLTSKQITDAFVAAGGNASEGRNFFAQIGGGARKYVVISVNLQNGLFTEYESADGGPEKEGYLAGYQEGAGSLLTVTSHDPSDPCVDQYSYTITGPTLRLRDLKPCAAHDGVYNATLFGSFPYARAGSSPSDGGLLADGTYATHKFLIPFSVKPPPWRHAPADTDESNFVTWTSDDQTQFIRFLLPTQVYPPGSSHPSPPPIDYLTYLMNQRGMGAQLTNVTKTTVGGRPATELTATTKRSLDGSLGCEKPVELAKDCYGLQPDFILRIAVVPLRGRTLLIWLRNDLSANSTARTTSTKTFETLLTTVRFRTT